MGFFDHLEELRGTLIRCAVVYLIFAGLIGIFVKPVHAQLLQPLLDLSAAHSTAAGGAQPPAVVVDLGTTTPLEGFSVILQLCFAGALIPSTPFFLYFLGQFVAPALTRRELRMVLPVCFAGLLLFVIGAVFSYFLLIPKTLEMAITVNKMLGYVLRWTPGSYFNMLTWMVLGVGAAFEFPLVILLLVYLGLLQVATLRKYRRHAVIAIFILAAIVTPTPDPFVQTMFAIPLYVLFEIAVLVGARVEGRRAARLGTIG